MSRLRAAREAVEDPPLELGRDALAGVLDGDAEVAVAQLRRDPDRRRAVARRVDEEVRHDALEHERIDDRGEIVAGRRARRRPRRAARPRRRRASAARRTTGRGSMSIALASRRERSSSSSSSRRSRSPCSTPTRSSSSRRSSGELGPALGERLEDAVDRRRRRPQLVRGDGDEVALELVELDRLLVEPGALDRDRDPLRRRAGAAPSRRA